MFNLFKKFRKNRITDFYCGTIPVNASELKFESGTAITYTCSFFDFTITFEYKIYDSVVNLLGVSTIAYKNTVIVKETHNISLSLSPTTDYIKTYFKRVIQYAQQLDANHLNVILPLFETKVFQFAKSLEIGLDSTHQHGFLYNVSLMQDNAPYNDYLNRNCRQGRTTFKIITYDDTVFSCLYNSDFSYELVQNQQQISQIDRISVNISQLLDDSRLTLDDYERNADKVFFNPEKKTALLYRVIKSQKDYHGSHMDDVDELYNYISLHLFWLVDFETKTTHLNIFVHEYDDNTFVKEYSHSMETKFKDELLDIAYYEDFFRKTVDKLIHCYYPSRKLLELLDSEIDLTGFDGTLTEDQYYLFKMINI